MMGYRKCVLILCIFNLFFEITNVYTHPVPAPHACIIGAGYSGLGAARYMKEYGVNFTIYEATRYIGGTWRFDPHVGTDEDGLPLFTSAYKNMRTNTIQQSIAYPGFPFPEDSPTYLSGTCVYKYLLAFAKQFDLVKNIQFHSLVTKVQWRDDKWHLTYTKVLTKENVTDECDFVVVATGEFSSPNIPNLQNQEEFLGKIIHSHDFKDAEDFRDLRVLVVGAGPSGLDVAVQLVNVTSALIHSQHFADKLPDIPGNYIRKPDIKYFTPTGAVFLDDSEEKFDVVIFCTGYTFNFPFLNYESAGVIATKRYVLPLYKQVVNINHPSMTFVGAGRYTSSLVRNTQGEYSAALAARQVKLPPQEEMFQYWFDGAKNLNYTDVNIIGNDNMAVYLDVLLNGTDIPKPPPVLATAIAENKKDWYEDLLHFRDNQYTILSDTEYVKKYKPTKEVCLFDVDE